jgi:hypothetical protein
MVKVTAGQLRASMNKKHNIRNISVIAHVDHGQLSFALPVCNSLTNGAPHWLAYACRLVRLADK